MVHKKSKKSKKSKKLCRCKGCGRFTSDKQYKLNDGYCNKCASESVFPDTVW